MKNIEFLRLQEAGKVVKTINKDYQLLSYFIGDFDKYMLEDYLPEFESVAKGEKSFEEIEDIDGYWSFGAEAGYFTCDTKKAYLKADKDGHHPDAPDVEMPIQELIDILKKWQKFLN